MIDWAVLKAFWNSLVMAAPGSQEIQAIMLDYMEIIGTETSRSRELLVRAIANQDVTRCDADAIADLDMRVCWQDYNIFLGGSDSFRSTYHHVPNPANLVSAGVPGATTFDFPVVAPPHGARANTLYRVHLLMEQVLSIGKGPIPIGPLQSINRLLKEVQFCEVIQEYDVNWYAVSKRRFWGMSRQQRQQFLANCHAAGMLTANGNEVYEATFGA